MKIAVLFAALFLAVPVQAAPAPSPPDPSQELEDAARQAAQKIVEALQLLLQAVPQYEAPEILPNGDIIIRRKPRKGERRRPEPPYDGPCEIAPGGHI